LAINIFLSAGAEEESFQVAGINEISNFDLFQGIGFIIEIGVTPKIPLDLSAMLAGRGVQEIEK